MLINLKAAILRSRLSQYQVAEKCGITETRFSRIIVGRIGATTEERKKIAELLDSDEKKLFAEASSSPALPRDRAVRERMKEDVAGDLLKAARKLSDSLNTIVLPTNVISARAELRAAIIKYTEGKR
jgi:transcriptional regulator with XRE-family HTH domain